MMLPTLLGQVAVATAGGFAAELVHWYALARAKAAPRYAKRPLYWFTTAAMIALGGVMPLLYLQGPASALLCFHLGAATPVIVQKLAAQAPKLIVGQGSGPTSLQDFFRW
jgi:hypothetical protein